MIKSNDRFHLVLDEIEDYATLLLDSSGNVLNWNKGAEKILGYKKAEIKGKSIELFHTPEDTGKKIPRKLLQQSVMSGKSSNEGWRVRKNGTRFWGNTVITAMMDESKMVIGFSVITRDLTEKKSLEEAGKFLLQTSEGLLRIFNASPSGMIIADTESGRLIEVNNSFLSTFNYKREEAIGLTADELGFVSSETQQKVFGKLKQQGFLKNEAVPAITKNGKRIHTIFSVERFEMKGRECFLCVFHDISDIREMEKRIIESENKFRKIIEEAGDVLYTTNAHGQFVYINPRVNVLTEYTEEELIGKHFSVLISPEWKNDVIAYYKTQFQNRVYETRMEFTILTKSGKEKWVEQVVIMHAVNGFIHGFQCIVRDITERKKTNLLLAAQKKTIERKNKDILDSINYAKHIQDAIFPPRELVKKILPQSFILLKPKDIISGDFYWIEKFNHKTFIAAADCTGHGVPGALLSIIGYNLLSKSINEHGHTKPNKILNELSNGISKTLRQSVGKYGVTDSMDIALCVIDRVNNVLEYAGAYNSIYLIRKKELKEIRADRFPIGLFRGEKSKRYTNHRIKLEKGDLIYLFSDGYPDQFGGPLGKKLKYNEFKRILLSIHHLPLSQQKNELDKTIEDWKWKKEEQTDDILIIGIKI
ncbi:MAG TPA: PAS domain S-box protein [Bacteroidia bacterium]|nr:PAS domain S-box protein [Bacteroidia bacterium]